MTIYILGDILTKYIVESELEIEVVKCKSLDALEQLKIKNNDFVLIDVDQYYIQTYRIRKLVIIFHGHLAFTSSHYDCLNQYKVFGITLYKDKAILLDYILTYLLERKEEVLANMIFDYEKREVMRDGKIFQIRNAGFLILKKLAENEGEICTREELLRVINRKGKLSEERTIDVHINYLRDTIPGIEIETVVNQGYVYRSGSVADSNHKYPILYDF